MLPRQLTARGFPGVEPDQAETRSDVRARRPAVRRQVQPVSGQRTGGVCEDEHPATAGGGSYAGREMNRNRAATAVTSLRQLRFRTIAARRSSLAERRTLIPGRRRPSIPAGRASVPMESRGRAWGVSPGLSGEAESANPSSVPPESFRSPQCPPSEAQRRLGRARGLNQKCQ